MQKKDNNTPLVYIVILNYRNWHEVIECLESVYRSKYQHFKIFVVDNDSQNDSLQNIMNWAANVPVMSSSSNNYFLSRDFEKISEVASLASLVFVQNEKNRGFAAGNNIVLRILADQDAFIWLLNPDIVIADTALSELVYFAQTQPPGSIIGSVIKFQDHPEKIHMYGGGRIRFRSATASLITKTDDIAELDYISGGSLFTHARQFENIGLLPENYFLYWEETDWCYQAKLQGNLMTVCLSSVCYDKVGTSIGRGFLAEYYYTRNGLLFLYKYKRKNIPMAMFFCLMRMIKKMVSGQWNRTRGLYKGAESFMKMISNGDK